MRLPSASHRILAPVVLGIMLLALGGSAEAATPGESDDDGSRIPAVVRDEPPDDGDVVRVATSPAWMWPVSGRFRIDRPFIAPATEYGPGHRGIDLLPLDGFVVRAPAAGVVAFVGEVAGRGILTIDHGGGLVTTLEPVSSPLSAGTRVERGEAVGEISFGGHTAQGRVHFGVRLAGEYVNPLLLLGGVPRARLLPCCAAP